MQVDLRPLAIAAVAAVLFGFNPARAESPTILMLNIDKYPIDLKVVDNLSPDKATVYSGTLQPGRESTPFKVRVQPGGTDFTWTATGKTDKGSAKRCGTVKDKNRGGRVDVLAGGTVKGETPVGKPC
jgi:hypothetical protein